MELANATSLPNIKELSQGKKLALVHFWASWAEPCKQMDAVLQQLAQEHSNVACIRVEAEVVDEASLHFNIENVPTVILLKDDKEVSRIEGADPAGVVAALNSALTAKPSEPSTATAGAQAQPTDINGRIKYLLSLHPVIVFMKGDAATPRCGFSGRVVRALQQLQVYFHTVDILQDQALRDGLKQYSNWPTYPQLYVKGELVGGCDIIEQMQASGDLKALFIEKLGPNYQTSSATPPAQSAPSTTPATAAAASAAAPAQAPQDIKKRLEQLVNKHPVMLFMKGDPQQPRCGFSKKVASALQSNAIEFDSFDILEDEAVRQGLKEYSNWPTYPQLYVKGELLGGCDIVLQMQEAGELKTTVEEMLHRMDTV